jgi:hypothetical protein
LRLAGARHLASTVLQRRLGLSDVALQLPILL